MKRKQWLAYILALCISIAISTYMIPASAVYKIVSETQLQVYYERHKDEQNFQNCFVWPEEVAFLGEFKSIETANYDQLAFRYNLDSSMDDGSTERILLAIYVGSLDMEAFLSNLHANHVGKIELIPLEMDYTLENMCELGDDNDYGSWYSVKRGKLEFIYESCFFSYIVWEQNGKTFRLEAYFQEWLGHSDHIFSDLLSTEPEPFLEAQRQLLNIGNPNPVPPEPEKACGGSHVYDTQWDYDRNTHWYPCICGVKSSQGFHTDEDENGQCDTCQYQMRREEVQEPTAPPAQPTTPTGPVAQPTEPTQPPTASPTTPATQPPPTPAEPNTPNAGLWIGVGSGIVCVAAVAVVLLLRKKKHT